MKKIEKFIAITAIGFVLGVVYHYILGSYFSLGFPYNTFLFTPMDKFNDFFNTIKFSEYLLKNESVYGHSMWNAYMPFSNIILLPFALINSKISLIIYIAIVVIGFYFILWVILKKIILDKLELLIITTLLTLLSYPLLFLLDRGNIEGITFFLIALFLVLYKKKYFLIASLILAILVNIKPFPIVFIALFFWDKKYKEITLTVVFTIFIFILSLQLLPGEILITLKSYLKELKIYDSHYVEDIWGIQYSHTLYIPLQVLSKIIPNFKQILKIIYFIFATGVFTYGVGLIKKYEVKYWMKVLFLVLCMIGLPFASADYTLIHLYFPILLFFIEKGSELYDQKINVVLALLIIPKQYYIMKIISLAMVINPILIFILFVLIFKSISKKETLVINVE